MLHLEFDVTGGDQDSGLAHGYTDGDNALMKMLESEDPQSYRNFIRMDKQDFDELLTKVTPFIQRRDTNMREPIYFYYFPIITEYLEPNDLCFPSKSH